LLVTAAEQFHFMEFFSNAVVSTGSAAATPQMVRAAASEVR
jgi:hypothetical protein